MRKVFEVELGARSGHFTQLILPSAPYAMLDALEKLRLEDGEAPTWATISVFNCERIADFIDEDGTLFELNALCQQLALLDEGQRAIVEGLAKMEYEGDETRALAVELGYIPVVPPKSNRKNPWDYDKQLYKQRNQVERLFRRIKRFRRIFTRYDKLDAIFLAFVYFALIIDALM